MSIQPTGTSPPIATPPVQPAAPPKAKGSDRRETALNKAELAPTRAALENFTQNQANKNETVTNALQKLNEFVSASSSDLQFTQDKDTGQTVIKVIDIKTKEVIRQMPTEEALQIAKALDKLQGLLVRDKA